MTSNGVEVMPFAWQTIVVFLVIFRRTSFFPEFVVVQETLCLFDGHSDSVMATPPSSQLICSSISSGFFEHTKSSGVIG